MAKGIETYDLELQSNVPLRQIDYELSAFALCREGEDVGYGAVEHFARAAGILWPMSCPKPFIVTKEVRMLVDQFVRYPVVMVTGHGSSIKTGTSSTFALVSVFAEPADVMCICVSTDIEGASHSRIYGQIKDFFGAINGRMSFKLNQSNKTLHPYDPYKLRKFPSSAGIKLVSGNANKEKEAEGKIKGYKMGAVELGRIILIADEGCDIADGIYKTFFSNLRGNNKAQLIGLANMRPNTMFHDICTPVDGWLAVQPSDQLWETESGVCVHFDGLQSANWLHHLAHPEDPENVYPFMQNWQLVQGLIDQDQDDSMDWWEQVRAYPPPVGVEGLGIYTSAEITQHRGDLAVRDDEWDGKPLVGSGTDPAFSEGGDKAMHCPWRCGMLHSGDFVFEWLEPIVIPIKAGEGNKAPAYQIVEFMIEWAERFGVDKSLMGYDSTDGNFKAIVQANGGREFFPVPFHGSSTDRVVMVQPPRSPIVRNSDWFANRVSEIWGIGPQFLRAGQLRGIKGQIKVEFTTREWKVSDSINQGRRLKCVEGKREMKKRLKGRSPDTGDGALIGLDTAISQLRWRVGMSPINRDSAKLMRDQAILKGRITPKHLSRHGGSPAFITTMFGGRAVKRVMPTLDPTKRRYL